MPCRRGFELAQGVDREPDDESLGVGEFDSAERRRRPADSGGGGFPPATTGRRNFPLSSKPSASLAPVLPMRTACEAGACASIQPYTAAALWPGCAKACSTDASAVQSPVQLTTRSACFRASGCSRAKVANVV